MADTATQVINAIHSGSYQLAAILAIIVLVQLAKTYGSKFWPLLAEGHVVVTMAVILGAAGALAASMTANNGSFPGLMDSLKLILGGAVTASSAVGTVKIFTEHKDNITK